jgi:hypothetical protein
MGEDAHAAAVAAILIACRQSKFVVHRLPNGD